MRKHFLTLVAVATTLLFSACNKHESPFISEDGNMVTFNISTPEMGTRAYSDGMTANNLTVAVYQGGTYRESLTQTATLQGGVTTVRLPLVTGVTYDIVFWAQANGAPYEFDAESGKVSVDYRNVAANNENLDAFYANKLNYTVEGAKSETIYLTRPFAQLNVAASDYEIAKNSGIEITQTDIEIEGVYTSFNLKTATGEIDATRPTTIRLALNNTPAKSGEELKGYEDYTWLSMNYLLVNEKTTIRAKMKTDVGTVTREWYNIPVQRNYRTNIVGNILTTTTDFNVIIDDDFKGDLNPSTAINSQESLAEALKNGGIIRLAKNGSTTKSQDADYVWPNITEKSFEIIGIEEGIVIDMNNNGAITSYIDVAFENVTLIFKNVNYSGFHHSNIETFKNCTIIGQPFLYAVSSTFDNCIFRQDSPEHYNVWTYGSNNATFNNCEFYSAGKAALVYKEQGQQWNKNTFNNCKFHASQKVEGKAAIEIDSSLNPYEVHINDCSSEGFDKGSVSKNTLWNNKKSTPDNLRVFVDGVQKYGNKEVIEIKNLEELKSFAKDVNNGNDYAGFTVILTNDIDLYNEEWTPIGTSSNGFKGIFDGQDHTISNLKITGYNSTVGLFANTYNGEIKNLTVNNAMVSGRLNVGVVAGNPYTSKYSNINVTGHVEVKGMSYVGGVGGKNAYANWTDVKVDVDETSFVSANSFENGVSYRTYVGGVCGFNGEGGHSFTNISSNIDVRGTTCDVGGLFGIAHYGNKFVNCSCSGDVEITDAEDASSAEEIGGIAGVWNNGGADVIFTNCSFTGTLKTNITEGVDLSDNTITGKAYSATGTGNLIINNN
ncbi:MAG: hypothetical protein IKC17_01500 [Bacteroidales bacterium]|nr:hypothetical protein [Bacteroidales bacterium]